MDYIPGPYRVPLHPGRTTATLIIPIIDDDEYEVEIENFTLTINETSLPTGVTIGTQDQTIVFIVDNDSKFQ